MPIDLSLKVDRVENISKEEFQEKYMKAQKPVIIKNFFGEGSPIYSKWSFDYFIDELGDLEVGIFDDENSDRDDSKSYKKADMTMKFGEYLNLLQTKPTQKRIFLFNIFKHLPELKKDITYPNLGVNFIKKLPFVFFGGKGAVTRIHQDMDMSNVFLTELKGKKRVVLFDPYYSDLLYRYPFGVHSSVNPDSPDYERFPGLDKVKGYECVIENGDTLFMPSGYWHHIEYLEGSFGVAVRSLSPSRKLRGLYNVAVLTHLDEMLRYLFNDKWFKTKDSIAKKRALKAMKKED
jgi:hypothetical protein